MPLVWTKTPGDAWGEYAEDFVRIIRRGVWELASYRAPLIEGDMKNNAPWTDRSSNARQTLNAKPEREGLDRVHIWLRHGMWYGIYLEFANAGRYAILAPTVDRWAPVIQQDLQRLLS